ncbi:MAG TPA: DUF4349 domain-containing protein [Gemmatimonadaceae bacterium]
MRKSSPAAARTIVLSALALGLVASCSDSKVADRAIVAQSNAGRAPEVAGGISAYSANDAPLGIAARAMPAPEAPVAGKSQRARPASGVSANTGSADISLGTPMSTVDPAGAMIVRHGEASVQVQEVNAAVSRIRQTAGQFGGFVGNTALVTGKDEQRSATLELRVPSAQFDAVVGALNQLGKVETVNVSAEDVSEEYVDLGARLANARRVEARLVEMLATRTGKLSDVLTVEQELARVRQEAERYEARIRWLERRASLSSLSVSLHEKIPLIEPPRGHGPIAEAFAEAWTRFVAFTAWLIASLGILVPAGAVIGVMIMVTRRLFGGGAPPKVPQV